MVAMDGGTLQAKNGDSIPPRKDIYTTRHSLIIRRTGRTVTRIVALFFWSDQKSVLLTGVDALI